MRVIEVRNVNVALAQGIDHLLKDGKAGDSRNGNVLVAPTPVCTVYHTPQERVLFGEVRDANPFFHLMESLWMLAGANDLEFPRYFNKRFGEYSDNGQTVHGAYGYRWRRALKFDQLEAIVHELKTNPTSRRCVLQMWDASLAGAADLDRAMQGGKDVPCNTHIYFSIVKGVLDMTVCCRSNDIIWGAYGANAVHFSVLMEYMATAIGVQMGTYYQMSNNFHAYTDIFNHEKLAAMAKESIAANRYITEESFPGVVQPYPLISTDIKTWDADLAVFMSGNLAHAFTDPFFQYVAVPMFMAWEQRKAKAGNGMFYINQMRAEDWKLACVEWILRREVA